MYITIASLTINNNATTFTINSGEDISSISPNSILYVAGASLPTQVSWEDGAPKLAEAWSENTFTTVKARIFVGIQGLVDAVDSAKTVSNNLKTKTDEVNAIITGQGTAASRNVTTSSTDTTADRVFKFGDFGLGRSVSIGANADLNQIVNSGFYRLESSPQNAPSGVEFGQLIVSRGLDTILQIVSGYFGSNIFWRSGNPPEVGGVGAWQPWRELYHTGNVNFTDFSANQADDLFSIGFAATSDFLVFPLYINGVVAPSSISVSGTFRVFDSSNNTEVGAGIVPTLDTGGTNKIARMRVTSIAGLTTGRSYSLLAETSSSKITVNF